MPLIVRCPQCQTQYQLGDEVAGKQFRCQKCQASFLIPGKTAHPSSSGAIQPALPRYAPAGQQNNPFDRDMDANGNSTIGPSIRRREREEDGSSLGLWIGLGVGLVVLLAAGGVSAYLLLRKPADPMEKLPKNLGAMEKALKKETGNILGMDQFPGVDDLKKAPLNSAHQKRVAQGLNQLHTIPPLRSLALEQFSFVDWDCPNPLNC